MFSKNEIRVFRIILFPFVVFGKIKGLFKKKHKNEFAELLHEQWPEEYDKNGEKLNQ